VNGEQIGVEIQHVCGSGAEGACDQLACLPLYLPEGFRHPDCPGAARVGVRRDWLVPHRQCILHARDDCSLEKLSHMGVRQPEGRGRNAGEGERGLCPSTLREFDVATERELVVEHDPK
jgi:hypothetical protein